MEEGGQEEKADLAVGESHTSMVENVSPAVFIGGVGRGRAPRAGGKRTSASACWSISSCSPCQRSLLGGRGSYGAMGSAAALPRRSTLCTCGAS